MEGIVYSDVVEGVQTKINDEERVYDEVNVEGPLSLIVL